MRIKKEVIGLVGVGVLAVIEVMVEVAVGVTFVEDFAISLLIRTSVALSRIPVGMRPPMALSP